MKEILTLAKHSEATPPSHISPSAFKIKDARIQAWIDSQPRLFEKGLDDLSDKIRAVVHRLINDGNPLLPSTFPVEIRRKFVELAWPVTPSDKVMPGKFDASKVSGYPGELIKWVGELKRTRTELEEPFDMAVKRAFVIREFEALQALYEVKKFRLLYVVADDVNEVTASDYHFDEILKILTSVKIQQPAVDFVDRCIFMALAERADTEELAAQFLEEAGDLQGFILHDDQRFAAARKKMADGAKNSRAKREEKITEREVIFAEILAEWDNDVALIKRLIIGKHLYPLKHREASKSIRSRFGNVGIRTVSNHFAAYCEKLGIVD